MISWLLLPPSGPQLHCWLIRPHVPEGKILVGHSLMNVTQDDWKHQDNVNKLMSKLEKRGDPLIFGNVCHPEFTSAHCIGGKNYLCYCKVHYCLCHPAIVMASVTHRAHNAADPLTHKRTQAAHCIQTAGTCRGQEEHAGFLFASLCRSWSHWLECRAAHESAVFSEWRPAICVRVCVCISVSSAFYHWLNKRLLNINPVPLHLPVCDA